MLPYALAIVVGLSSSILFVSAFFFKDRHRQDDFLWSGVGLFYALTLWYGSNNIRGSLLLGQLAAVCLLTAYFWQVWNLRLAIAKPEENIAKESFSVVEFTKNLFNRKSSAKNSQDKNSQSQKTKFFKKKNPNNKIKPATKNNAAPPKSASKATTKSQASEPVETPTAKVVSTKNMAPPVGEPKEAATSPKLTTEQVPQPDNRDNSDNKQASANSEEINENQPEAQLNTEEHQQDQISANQTTTQADPVATSQQIQAIQVEEVNIIEEESNWDDEVEDIDPESVTVIEVEASPAEAEEENQDQPN